MASIRSKLRIEELFERIFPGLGLGPAGLTVLSCLCLVVYHHHGALRGRPEWFLDLGRRVTGIEPSLFHDHAWSHLSAVVVLMLVPLALCRLLGGWKLSELGLSPLHAGRELILVLILWVAFLPVVWLMSGTAGFAATYPRFPPAETDAGLFCAYEGLYLAKWIAWEFFFRGFMLFGFKRTIGARAVLVSTLPFVLMHFGKPEAEVFAAIAAGFILCWIALRSRSIWPGVLLHWLVATSMDFFASSFWR